MSTHPQNPPPLARPIRRRPAASPPPQIQPSKLSSNIPSLSAVRRTLFHSSSSSSRLHARAASQAHQQIQQSQQQQYPPAPMNAPPVVVKDACLRGEGEEIVERDAQGGVLMEGVLNMGVFPRDERMEEDSDLERSLISELYRHEKKEGVELEELRRLLQGSLAEKVRSLGEDAWMFGAEEEVLEEHVA